MKSFSTRILKRWLDQSGNEGPITPMVPEGERYYAIGDIHGCLAPLQRLHEMILQDSGDFSGQKTIVYLGDYIDRGKSSREVVDFLLDEPLAGFNPVYLLGNHEQSLMDFLQHPRSVAAWLTYGGRATLHSYGVAVGGEFGSQDLEELRDDFACRFPQRHLDFFKSMNLYHLAGSYCFVHAGIRPGIALTEQRNEDLLWIRDDFTRSRIRHDHIVVHGHSITTEVDWNDNRIGIDTGAFHSGVLSCLVLEGGEQRLLQTGIAEY